MDAISYAVESIPDITGLPRTAVYEAIRRGELRSLKVGRRRLVRREALDEFLLAREHAGQPGRHGETEQPVTSTSDRGAAEHAAA